MKFVIQKINNEIRHDFSFTLLESIKYHNWLTNGVDMKCKFINTRDARPTIDDTGKINLPQSKTWSFKDFHINYVPVGSVEFVLFYMKWFSIEQPKPMNVPDELIPYAGREIINGNEMTVEFLFAKPNKYFIKSNDVIKGLSEFIDTYDTSITLPKGNYQISEFIDIQSEWRCFVYKGELVGVQNYSGDFTLFPDVWKIKNVMIPAFKSAPIAYTLDVGIVNDVDTVVIECHPMMSVGLYGFSDHRILPHMFHRTFNELAQKKIV